MAYEDDGTYLGKTDLGTKTSAAGKEWTCWLEQFQSGWRYFAQRWDDDGLSLLEGHNRTLLPSPEEAKEALDEALEGL